jgi:hypothetical protein
MQAPSGLGDPIVDALFVILEVVFFLGFLLALVSFPFTMRLENRLKRERNERYVEIRRGSNPSYVARLIAYVLNKEDHDQPAIWERKRPARIMYLATLICLVLVLVLGFLAFVASWRPAA